MKLTDPARELATTIELLTTDPVQAVDQRIAQDFGINRWSPQVFKVIFEILNRCDLVASEINKLPLDVDVADEATKSLTVIRNTVGSNKFLNQTTGNLKTAFAGSNITILKMLSSQIRANVSYAFLTKDEVKDILADVSNLIEWLDKFQAESPDFIRQALIDGLKEFSFRLKHLGWFGSGYTLTSLKEVLHAYLALQGAVSIYPDGSEVNQAILLKVKSFMLNALSKFNLIKETSDSTEWVLKAYGAFSALSDGSQTISGLIGN